MNVGVANTIAITLGDPSGIGPEVVANALVQVPAALRARCRVYGDKWILERAFEVQRLSRPQGLDVVDVGGTPQGTCISGTPDDDGARAQVAYLQHAISDIKAGAGITGLVTAPISKQQLRRAGIDASGHTDYLAATFSRDVAMMFVGPKLRVVLATVHQPLVTAIRALSTASIENTTALAVEAMRRSFGIPEPRVGVLGVNPHAGEGGLLGTEEREVIEPALARLRRRFPRCGFAGPLVPDVAFRRALGGDYDVMVAMYHDQGLIPVKLIDFESSVNVTIGLPFIRTSPDHGVAYDIAGRGIARPHSFIAALTLAERLS